MANLWEIWLAKSVTTAAALGKEAINSLQGNEQVVETSVKRMEGAFGTQISSYSCEPEQSDNFICCLASCGQ